jgi:hypothetical protein
MLDYMVRFGIPVDASIPQGSENMEIKVFGHELSYLLFKAGSKYVVQSRMLVQYKAMDAIEDRTVSFQMDSDDPDAIKLHLAKKGRRSLEKHIASLQDDGALKELIGKKKAEEEEAK